MHANGDPEQPAFRYARLEGSIKLHTCYNTEDAFVSIDY